MMLDMNEIGIKVNKIMYRGMKGFLLYLKSSCFDNIFNMGLCVYF